MNKLSVAICLFLTILSQGFAFEDCGSKLGEIVHISVTNCPDPDARCVLVRNKKVTLTVEFSLKEAVTNATNIVHGVILGLPVPFDLPNPNACLSHALKCPLEAGGPYKFEITMPIEKKYPRVTVDVKWQLQNEKEEDIFCVLIPAKIQ